MTTSSVYSTSVVRKRSSKMTTSSVYSTSVVRKRSSKMTTSSVYSTSVVRKRSSKMTTSSVYSTSVVRKRSSKMTTSSVYSTSVVRWSKDGDKQHKMFASFTSFPHVWKQLLSSGDHTFEEILDVEDAFQLHGPCRSNDGVVVFEQGDLEDDGPFALGRCRGSSVVGSFYLEAADVKGNIIVITFYLLQASRQRPALLSLSRTASLPSMAGTVALVVHKHCFTVSSAPFNISLSASVAIKSLLARSLVTKASLSAAVFPSLFTFTLSFTSCNSLCQLKTRLQFADVTHRHSDKVVKSLVVRFHASLHARLKGL